MPCASTRSRPVKRRGSERLKGAPLLVVSPMAGLLFVRRRYRCPDCAWRGWKYRLRRLGKPATLIILTQLDATQDQRPAVVDRVMRLPGFKKPIHA